VNQLPAYLTQLVQRQRRKVAQSLLDHQRRLGGNDGNLISGFLLSMQDD
jgi:hypothetical protein